MKSIQNLYKHVLSEVRNTKKVARLLLIKYSSKSWPYVLVAGFFYTARAWVYIREPQLYAEDGVVWLADAHNKGPASLIEPLNGFFHLTERLFGFTMSILPLSYLPFLYNLTALLIFSIFLHYLFSSRSHVFNSVYEKMFALLSICLIANMDEFFFNFSNSVFLLGLIGILLPFLKVHKLRVVMLAEKILFILCCFTLPFSWVYVPILLFDRLKNKTKNSFYLLAATAGSIFQILALVTSATKRSTSVAIESLFTPEAAMQISNQIIIPALRFARIDLPINSGGFSEELLAIFAVLTVALASLFIFIKSNSNVKYFLLFCAAMTFASLKSPLIEASSSLDAVKIMATVPSGDRYFIFGILALFIVFAKICSIALDRKGKWYFLILYISLGLLSSLHYNSFFVEKNFTDYRNYYYSKVELLRSNTPPSQVVIPVNPGKPWAIKLYLQQ